MKKLLVVFLHLVALSSYGWDFSEGAYEAKIDSKNDAFLMLKKISGRSGSFMATLMQAHKDDITGIAIYVMDEMKGGSYSLTPISLVDNGELGLDDDNPSLVVIKDRDVNKFKVTSSQSGNVLGFSGSVSFEEGRTARYEWHLSRGGDYNFSGKEEDASVVSVAVSTNDIENDAVFSSEYINGIFKIRQKLDYVYALNSNKLMSTGYERETVPALMAIFVQENRKKGFSKKWVKRNSKVILVNPSNYSNLSVLIRK